MRSITFALVAGLVGLAQAQDVFVTPGSPTLTETGIELDDALAFVDAGGFAWTIHPMVCHDPRQPEAEPRPLTAPGAIGNMARVFSFLSPERDRVLALVEAGNGGYDFIEGRCDGPAGPGGEVGQTIARLRWQDSPLGEQGNGGAWRALNADLTLGEVLGLAPDGRACLFLGDPPLAWGETEIRGGFYCFDPSTDPPTVERLFGAEDLDAWLAPDPHHGWAGFGGDADLEHSWAMRAFTWLPDGRLVMVPELRWRGQRGNQTSNLRILRQIILWEPDASPAVVFAPHNIENGPASGLRSIEWDAERRLLWAFVEDDDYMSLERTAQGGEVSQEIGWRGFGLRAFGLDGGTGYLSLSDVIARAMTCDDQPLHATSCPRAIGRADARLGVDGGFVVTTPRTWERGRGNSLMALAFDEDRVDLDGDGLPAADEARAGSSDLYADGDGGGTLDGLEVLFGRDPTDPGDDSAHGTEFLFGHRTTTRVLPEALGLVANGPFMPARSLRGPICDREMCVDRDGMVYPNPLPPEVAVGVKAVDGERLVGLAEDGSLVEATIRDGVTRVLAHAADLAVVVGSIHEEDLFPVDETSVWISRQHGDGQGSLYHVADGQVRLVFDLEKARCDSGLGPCDPIAGDDHLRLEPVQDLYEPIGGPAPERYTGLGHVEELNAFLVGVIGVWDRWLLIITPEGRVTPIQRARTLAGHVGESYVDQADSGKGYPFLPPAAWNTPLGGLDTGPFGVVYGPDLDGAYAANLGYPIRPETAGWGDVMLQDVCCGTWEDGLWINFVEPARATPGDVILLEVEGPVTRPDRGAMLYRLPPRGGLVPLWSQRVPWIHAADGMDIRASDGRMCIADSGQYLHILALDPDGRWELLDRGRFAPGVRDCRFDAAGRLVALFDDPPRVATIDEDGGTTVLAELAAGRRPVELLAERGGVWDVRLADENLRASVVLADGRRVDMARAPDGMSTLRIDGEDWQDIGTLVGISLNQDNPATGFEYEASMVALPDGTVGWIPRNIQMKSPGPGLYGNFSQAHPDDQPFHRRGNSQFSIVEGTKTHAIAVYPGGRADDPWRGPATDAPAPATEPARGGGGNNDDSCAGGGTLPSALLLLVLGRWRRRRRREGIQHPRIVV